MKITLIKADLNRTSSYPNIKLGLISLFEKKNVNYIICRQYKAGVQWFERLVEYYPFECVEYEIY